MAQNYSGKSTANLPLGNGPCYRTAYIGADPGMFSGVFDEPKPSGGVNIAKQTMTPATDHLQGGSLVGLLPSEPRADAEESRLREILRRCSPATRDAACEFRRSGNLDCVPAIVVGVIEHYVVPEARAKLRAGDDTLRLSEDLSIDSLTMLEIVFMAEEVLQVSIDNEELRPFRTVGDVKRFVRMKLSGAAA